MVHFLKLKYRISFSGLRLLRQLPYQFQCLTGITQFEKLGTFLSSWRIWAVKSDAQTAIKRAEYHAMPPVLGEEWLFLLSPRTGYFSGNRLCNADSVFAVHETGPDHQQFACHGAIEETSVSNIRFDGVALMGTSCGPGSGRGVKQGQVLPCSFGKVGRQLNQHH